MTTCMVLLDTRRGILMEGLSARVRAEEDQCERPYGVTSIFCICFRHPDDAVPCALRFVVVGRRALPQRRCGSGRSSTRPASTLGCCCGFDLCHKYISYLYLY
jgi:hypothetical protein